MDVSAHRQRAMPAIEGFGEGRGPTSEPMTRRLRKFHCRPRCALSRVWADEPSDRCQIASLSARLPLPVPALVRARVLVLASALLLLLCNVRLRAATRKENLS